MPKSQKFLAKKQKDTAVVLDAKGESLGRLASHIASLLQGKDKPSYLPYKDEGCTVEVKNLSQVRITGKKLETKLYWHYTGYPGGIRSKSMGELWGKDPADVLHRAVFGMLPKNKFRTARMKRLKIGS